MCLYPRVVNHYGFDGRVDRVNVFPCGKCPECVKKKQNDYVQRFCLAASQHGTLWFFTFTFTNESIPLAVVRLDCDEQLNLPSVSFDALKSLENGLKFDLDSSLLTTQLRQDWIDNCPRVVRHGRPVQLNRPYFFTVDLIRYSVTASLDNRTVQVVMKQFREFYRRSLGRPLDFKFVFVGEYGSFGSRPHYHALLFGLDKDQAAMLSKFWQERFGLSTYEFIPILCPDGRSHHEFVARYVSKYMVKGSFEDNLVKSGYVLKPRVQISSNLVVFSPYFVSWYSGSDIFPSQDLPIGAYKDEDLDRLIARHLLAVGSHSYSLGRSIKSKLFYRKEYVAQFSPEGSQSSASSSQFKVRYKATNLQKALSLRLQSRALARAISEFENFAGQALEDSSSDSCQSFAYRQLLDKLSAAQEALSLQRLIYIKSKF